MNRPFSFVLLALCFVLGSTFPRAQTSRRLVPPYRLWTPPGVERLLPSVGPYGKSSEDWFLGVSSEWVVFTKTGGPNEEWSYILHHIPTGVSTGTGLLSHELFHSAAFSPSGTVFFQGACEFCQLTDFNGDGDASDIVLHVFDLQTWTTQNTGLAIGLEMSDIGTGTTVLFPVAETVDENGDGDTDDWIVYGGDLATNTIVSSKIATSSDRRWEFWIEGAYGAWLVLEEPGTDYTGDGDFVDQVYFVYDFTRGFGVNLGLAHSGDAVLTDGVFAFTVDEAEQGADLDGDGIADDRVLHTFDFTTGSLTNVGEACEYPVIGADRVGFQHQTTGTFQILNLITGAITDSGIVLGGRPTYVEGHFVIDGVEQATDWNGDGDTEDHVLSILEVASGNTLQLGVATVPPPFSHFPPWYQRAGSRILFVQDEAGQGATDLNGDGDALDGVWSLYSTRTGVVRSLRLAAPGWTTIAGGVFGRFAALAVDERAQGVDLDRDGSLYSNPWVTLLPNQPKLPLRVLDGHLIGAPEYTQGLGWWALTLQDMYGGVIERNYAVAVFED